MHDWQVYLYLPLGLVPPIFFGLRFLIQWYQSERAGQSVVPIAFWRLSLVGNCLMMLHLFIQMQFPLALLQVVNAVISWRNLNLMGVAGPVVTTKRTLKILIGLVTVLTAVFILHAWFLGQELEWFRTPIKPWDQFAAPEATFSWHLLGVVGGILFASRFWVQWWEAERHQNSSLGPSFWWLSLVGNLLSLTYFVRLDDLVNILNTGFGFLPAIRNLLFLRRVQTRSK